MAVGGDSRLSKLPAVSSSASSGALPASSPRAARPAGAELPRAEASTARRLPEARPAGPGTSPAGSARASTRRAGVLDPARCRGIAAGPWWCSTPPPRPTRLSSRLGSTLEHWESCWQMLRRPVARSRSGRRSVACACPSRGCPDCQGSRASCAGRRDGLPLRRRASDRRDNRRTRRACGAAPPTPSREHPAAAAPPTPAVTGPAGLARGLFVAVRAARAPVVTAAAPGAVAAVGPAAFRFAPGWTLPRRIGPHRAHAGSAPAAAAGTR
eukprot:scaffold10373_cov118-Isochrysis_galbana.AAC.3